MPGICGFYNVSPQADAAKLAERMLERLSATGGACASQYADLLGRFALGRVSLGILPESVKQASLCGADFHAVMDGELDDLDTRFNHGHTGGPPPDQNAHVVALLKTYVQDGIHAMAEFDGSFSAAIVDVVGQSLVLISDRFGTRPIYYAHVGERFCFASSIHALLADRDIPRDADSRGISQFFAFGHYFNNDTSLKDVKVLPAGAILVFDGRTNKISLRPYWTGAERVSSRFARRDEAYEAINDALLKAVRKRQRCYDGRIGISLSGGLDARTILGTLDRSQNHLTTLCMGMHGSKDHTVSTKLARTVGCQHHNHVLDRTFLAEFGSHLDAMVRLTDGQYLSQCIVMPTLPAYRRLDIGVLMRGHAGELMHMTKAYNYSLDATALSLRTDGELESWLWNRLRAHLHIGVEEPLFVRHEWNNQQVARDSLRVALQETPDGEPPAQRIAHLFLDQRVRRETMLSMMKFRSVVEPRLPYLDRTLVEHLLAIPTEWKLDDEIQLHILRRCEPKFCNIENTNTGAPLGAGKLRRSYARLKTMTFSKLGLPGYQPYERLGLWLRRDLADLVRKILLTESCLDRGVFCADTVRAVVTRHLTGQRNHTYLIMAMMIFEVGHRWLCEE
jgi:asparagine synthase (glutamine-hydrolysing)